MEKAGNKTWHRVVVSFACFAFATDDKGTILDSAPIGRKFMGQNISSLKRWIESKGGTVEEL